MDSTVSVKIQDPAEALYETCLELSASSRKRAEVLKVLNICVNLGVIVSGAAITVSAAVDDPELSKWLGLSLGLVITVGKSVSSIFGLEAKAVTLKNISTRARMVSRTIGDLLLRTNRDDDEYRRDLAKCYQEFDSLDILAFSATTGVTHRRGVGGSGNPSPTGSRE